ncbi:MAG: D-alanine--D-alanine ligase [Ruminococcaceae bacterium]|nr:D-alanine--D-alanine ligase [Oscillospiraceae bacterium]
MKTKVAVLFGGKSVEHEVSIISALQAYHALDREKYDPIAVYLSKDNDWYIGEGIDKIESYKNMKACLAAATRVMPIAAPEGVALQRVPQKKFGNNTVATFEVALPVVHGTNVEDGTLMGMLEMLGVPYAACDVTSSALGMDKFAMKAVLKMAGLPVLDAVTFRGRAWAADSNAVLSEIEARFTYPVIVKPVNLGSSVGISLAHDRNSLQSAMDTACTFADRVLVESAVQNLREINCAVLGDADDAIPSVCERPVSAGEILDFEQKYLQGGKSAEGMRALKRVCPADIPDELAARVQDLAVKTFKALGCCGVSRIDFLNNTETDELYVNEINTIPGSLAFYLWEASGLAFPALLDRMIDLAFKRKRDRKALNFSFESNILDGFGGAKGAKGKA